MGSAARGSGEGPRALPEGRWGTGRLVLLALCEEKGDDEATPAPGALLARILTEGSRLDGVSEPAKSEPAPGLSRCHLARKRHCS